MQGNLVGSTLVLVAWSYVIGPRSVLAQGNNNQIDPYGGNYGDGNRGQGAYTPVPSPTYGGNDEEQGGGKPSPAPTPRPTPAPTPASVSALTSSNAASALKVELINNNSWTDATSGKKFEQNNYLLRNTGDRDVCGMVMTAPLNSNLTKGSNVTRRPPFYSSYNVQSCNVSAGQMELRFPTWADIVYKKGGVVPFGYIIHGYWNGSATEGPATVEHARFCDDGDNETGNGRMLRLRRDFYERRHHHRKLEEEKRA
ncbi:Hypothetical protein NocV09_03100600 [Nannochloropsis oceanica]